MNEKKGVKPRLQRHTQCVLENNGDPVYIGQTESTVRERVKGHYSQRTCDSNFLPSTASAEERPMRSLIQHATNNRGAPFFYIALECPPTTKPQENVQTPSYLYSRFFLCVMRSPRRRIAVSVASPSPPTLLPPPATNCDARRMMSEEMCCVCDSFRQAEPVSEWCMVKYDDSHHGGNRERRIRTPS